MKKTAKILLLTITIGLLSSLVVYAGPDDVPTPDSVPETIVSPLGNDDVPIID